MKLNSLRKKTIGVLMGGTSSEREISLKTGMAVYRALLAKGFKAVAIDVDDGIIEKLRKHNIDIAFIALHGPLGEDGTIQGVLEVLRLPYTGSGVLASALAMDKIKSKEIFAFHGILTPSWQVARHGHRPIVRRFPVVVKPFRQGSAVGVTVVGKKAALDKALKLAFRYGPLAIVEEYIKGKELTVGILNDQTLPVIQIIPRNEFYDFESKYAPAGSRHLVPAPISGKQEKEARSLALASHRVLGCSGATRVDLLLDGKGRFFVLEVNTIPGMTETSLLPDAAKAAGYDFPGLVVEMLKDAGLDKN